VPEAVLKYKVLEWRGKERSHGRLLRWRGSHLSSLYGRDGSQRSKFLAMPVWISSMYVVLASYTWKS